MATATNSIVINRPAGEVYRFLADGLNNPKWRPRVVAISLASGTGGMTGAVYKQTVKGPMSQTMPADYQIVTATPDSYLRFDVVAGPARPVGVFELAPADGGTRVTFTLSFEPSGLMRMMSGMIQSAMDEEVGNLAAVKSALESKPG